MHAPGAGILGQAFSNVWAKDRRRPSKVMVELDRAIALDDNVPMSSYPCRRLDCTQ
jgi:hypothetical protein